MPSPDVGSSVGRQRAPAALEPLSAATAHQRFAGRRLFTKLSMHSPLSSVFRDDNSLCYTTLAPAGAFGRAPASTGVRVRPAADSDLCRDRVQVLVLLGLVPG